MKFSSKLVAGYIAITVMIIICSLAGLRGVSQLGDLLEFVTGPAWDTADGAMEGSIGIELQMLAAERIMSGDESNANERLQAGGAMAEQALDRLFAASLLQDEDIEALKNARAAFDTSRQQALDDYYRFANASDAMNTQLDAFQTLMVEAEKLGDSQVESLRTSPTKRLSWNDGLRERWTAADGAMEAHIHLLESQYLLEKMLRQNQPEIRSHIETTLTRLNIKINDIQKLSIFSKTSVNVTQAYEGMSYNDALEEANANYADNLNNVTDKWLALRETKRLYMQDANRLLDLLENLEEAADNTVESQALVINETQNSSIRWSLQRLRPGHWHLCGCHRTHRRPVQ